MAGVWFPHGVLKHTHHSTAFFALQIRHQLLRRRYPVYLQHRGRIHCVVVIHRRWQTSEISSVRLRFPNPKPVAPRARPTGTIHWACAAWAHTLAVYGTRTAVPSILPSPPLQHHHGHATAAPTTIIFLKTTCTLPSTSVRISNLQMVFVGKYVLPRVLCRCSLFSPAAHCRTASVGKQCSLFLLPQSSVPADLFGD